MELLKILLPSPKLGLRAMSHASGILITFARVAMIHRIQHWTTRTPLVAAALLVLTTAIGEQPWLLMGCVASLIAAVLAAVHHAEVHRQQ